MPKTQITAKAWNDFREIQSYIAKDNPIAAKKTLQLLLLKCKLLAQTPKIGASYERYRNLHMFPVGSFLVFYRPIKNGVEIIRVLHSSRDVENIL
jgi:toxin ParE1/3/4